MALFFIQTSSQVSSWEAHYDDVVPSPVYRYVPYISVYPFVTFHSGIVGDRAMQFIPCKAHQKSQCERYYCLPRVAKVYIHFADLVAKKEFCQRSAEALRTVQARNVSFRLSHYLSAISGNDWLSDGNAMSDPVIALNAFSQTARSK